MENGTKSQSSMPLVSRLDHLDFVLCLELESSSTSSTSTSISAGCASSSLRSRGQVPISRSLPTFINSNQVQRQGVASHQFLFTRSEIQEESEAMLQKKKDSNPLKKQVGNKRSSKKEKISKMKTPSGKVKVMKEIAKDYNVEWDTTESEKECRQLSCETCNKSFSLPYRQEEAERRTTVSGWLQLQPIFYFFSVIRF
ncbi:hypothetical protein CCACVL1_15111 [Corchorus capsularis]|uniref:Uncharacterized protein n=1 Tax=Corchorus capsularis TaxID=210143 RepID=A0A1R3I3W8_COCAP|nr:hypothetical protein CCACVL1_15111 [Corchorus capsularis]